MPSILWSKEEDDILKVLRPYCHSKEVAEVLRLLGYARTPEGVKKRSKALGIRFIEPGTPDLSTFTPSQVEAFQVARSDRNVNPTPPPMITSSQKSALTTFQRQTTKALYDDLQELRDVIPRTSSLSRRTQSGSGETAVIVLSDFHIGKLVVDDTMRTVFNTQIGVDRLDTLYGKISDAIFGREVDEVIIVLAGDHVDGEGIYPGQEMNLETHVVDQIKMVVRALWNLTVDLKEDFPIVRIVSCRGNHGRTGLSDEANWDNIIYQQLELLVDMTNDPNLTIKNIYGNYNTFEVRGWKGLVRHNAPIQADTASAISRFAGWHGMHDWDFMCFLPGTKIITSNGLIRLIEDIAPKTYLLDGLEKESITQVLEVHPTRHIDDTVISFKTEGVPQELISGCTKEHPFYIAKGLKCRLNCHSDYRCTPVTRSNSYPCNKCKEKPSVKPKWVKAKDIEKGDYVAVPFPKIPENSKPYTDGLCKLLGYYLAEGHILKESRKDRKLAHRGVGWTFHEDETSFHKEIEMLVKIHFDLDLHFHYQSESKAVQLIAFGKEISEFFAVAGGEYAENKCFNSWIWTLGEKDRMDLLSGWLLGDANKRTRLRTSKCKSQEISGCTVSPNLASQMFLLALSLGLVATFRISHQEKNDKSLANFPSHFISFHGKYARKIMEYNNIAFETTLKENSREKTTSFFFNDLFWTRIQEIKTYQYSGPVYNIRTSSEHYTAGHLLTHNCYGHWHHWGAFTWNGKPIFRNGSLGGGDDYAEQFGAYDKPAQLLFCVSNEQLPSVVIPIVFEE